MSSSPSASPGCEEMASDASEQFHSCVAALSGSGPSSEDEGFSGIGLLPKNQVGEKVVDSFDQLREKVGFAYPKIPGKTSEALKMIASDDNDGDYEEAAPRDFYNNLSLQSREPIIPIQRNVNVNFPSSQCPPVLGFPQYPGGPIIPKSHVSGRPGFSSPQRQVVTRSPPGAAPLPPKAAQSPRVTARTPPGLPEAPGDAPVSLRDYLEKSGAPFVRRIKYMEVHPLCQIIDSPADHPKEPESSPITAAGDSGPIKPPTLPLITENSPMEGRPCRKLVIKFEKPAESSRINSLIQVGTVSLFKNLE